MIRAWVYQRMMDDVALQALLAGGIHESTSMDKAPTLKPFIFYRNTSNVNLIRGDDADLKRRQGYMILVHDTPGTYIHIDDICDRLRILFSDIVDQDAGIRSEFVEGSDDWRDEDMGTIMKYVRIQLNYQPVMA